MERCNVIIVGGGPAGSTCARQLTRAGLDVVILDKQSFPRDKVCAGWITPAVVEELELDTADYARHHEFQPIHSFRTGMIGGPEVFTDYDTPVSYGIRRREFDDYLLHRSGARLKLGSPVKSLHYEGGEWVINNELCAPMLIGAGGHYCPVARHLGAKLGKSEQVVAAQEVEFEMTPAQAAHCSVSGETPELYFCRDLAGYGWCFRKGNYLNIGLGRDDSRQLAKHIAEFCDFLVARGKIPADIPDRFHGHAYLLYRQLKPRRVSDDGVLLIGDAAGLAYPQSGEGIRPAVESTLLAAETVIKSAGNFTRQGLAGYEQGLAARFGERTGSPSTAAWLPSTFKQRIAARLLSSRRFTRHVVLDRWFLHSAQPAMQATVA